MPKAKPQYQNPHLAASNPYWVTWSAPVLQALQTGPRTAQQLSHHFDLAELGGVANCLVWLEDHGMAAYDRNTNKWSATSAKPPTPIPFCVNTFVELVSQKYNVKVTALLDPTCKVGKVVTARTYLFGYLAHCGFTQQQLAVRFNWPVGRVELYVERYLHGLANKVANG